MGITEKEFLDKMIALAKAGEDEMEHLKCMFYRCNPRNEGHACNRPL